MRVTQAVPSYNERRYSRPWIARVTAWPVGKKAELVFGSFLGRDGCKGTLEIEAEAGDLVRWGQKDNRVPGNTKSAWGVVEADGTIREVPEHQAREEWERRQQVDLPAGVEPQEDAHRTAGTKYLKNGLQMALSASQRHRNAPITLYRDRHGNREYFAALPGISSMELAGAERVAIVQAVAAGTEPGA